MNTPYYVSRHISVDRFCAVKLASLNFKEESERMDDRGALWVAPINGAGFDVPLGLLAVYVTTNGDPIQLGQIEGGEITWTNATDSDSGMDESLRETLLRAEWDHRPDGEGYSYLVMDAVGSWEPA